MYMYTEWSSSEAEMYHIECHSQAATTDCPCLLPVSLPTWAVIDQYHFQGVGVTRVIQAQRDSLAYIIGGPGKLYTAFHLVFRLKAGYHQ